MTENRCQRSDDGGQKAKNREYGSRKGEFGLIPVEIKYTQTVPSIQLRALRDFIKDQNCCFGLVINSDEGSRLYDEQIAGIPFACL